MGLACCKPAKNKKNQLDEFSVKVNFEEDLKVPLISKTNNYDYDNLLQHESFIENALHSNEYYQESDSETEFKEEDFY
jgi:hypothetical protein